MKQLMFDHFRRWWWVLALAALLEFRLGWSMARRPTDPFEFWAFMVTLWCSATLLSFDLRRGILRPVAVLPLKARQIGRAWWLATVPVPALALTALLFLGAAMCRHFYPQQFFPGRHLTMAILFTLVWLFIGFTMIFNATRGLGEGASRMALTSITSLLCMVLFFGSMLLSFGLASSPWRVTVLLGVGAVMTVVGWWQAEQFDPGLAWLYLGRIPQPDPGRLERSGTKRPANQLTPLELKTPRGHYQVPTSHGRLAFLVQSSSIRSFAMMTALILLMTLISMRQQQGLPGDLARRVLIQTSSYFACAFGIIYQVLPVLRHLRLLRTLPISSTRLAAVVIGLVVLPLVAVGTVASVIAGPLLGAPAAIDFLRSYTFVLAPGSLCVFFALWRGEGVLGWILMIGTLFGFLKVQGQLLLALHTTAVPLGLIGAIAASGVLLSYLLACLVLGQSSHAYRVRISIAGSFPWSAGR